MIAADDAEILDMIDEFWSEHDRDPHCSEELVRWWARRKPQHFTISAQQLAAAGFELRDGKLFAVSTGEVYWSDRRSQVN